ncbi:MAG: glycosyltransferase [Alicyclobacillus sp.]|nr:glycosyltransferase [Alicyclobacillus sp.]
MRILIIVDSFWPAVAYGGPAQVALQHAHRLVKDGHEVTVLTSNIESLLPSPRFFPFRRKVLDGIEVHYLPASVIRPPGRRPRWGALFSSTLPRWLREHAGTYDIAHHHFSRSPFSLSAAKALQALGVPHVLQTHGMLDRRDGVRDALDRLVTSRLLEQASFVLCLQEQERGVIQRIAPRAKTLILPNGIDTDCPAKRWGSTVQERPTVLFVARLHPIKRPQDFVEMARILTDRGHDFTYHMIGPDEGMRPGIAKLIEKYGLRERVSLRGAVSTEEVYEELSKCAVYVLPSAHEPFGMSVVEALSVGVPTVVTDCTGISSMLREHLAAVVVPPMRPAALADGVERIVLEPSFAEELSRKGRSFIAHHLSIHSVVDKLVDTYRRAVTGKEK